jgi:membrane dipeptidase
MPISIGESVSRREALTRLAGAAAASVTLPMSLPALGGGPRPGAHGVATAWPGYDRAMAIDFLASVGPFNTTQPATPLSDAMVRNAAASGITAINLTVDGSDFPTTMRRIGTWERELNVHGDVLMRVRSRKDLDEAKRTRRLGIIYGFQGVSAIGSDLSLVATYAAFGVKIIQLTYNTRSLVGDGSLEPGNAGLSTFGRDLVAELGAQRVIVDLSHCGQRTTAEGIAASSRPVAISHSGCAALADVPRNKRDVEMRALAEKGGVFGVYLMPFLTPGRQPTLDDVVRHIEHAVQVCGEDHVGIGSDLSITPHDVTEEYRRDHRAFVERRKAAGIAAPGEDPNVYFFVPDLNTPRRLEKIADALLTRKHSESRVDKIIGGNFVRLMQDVWGA